MILALRKLKTTIGGKSATLEVADSPVTMGIGLSERMSLDPDCGMIFDPGKSCQSGFHMVKTYIPLSLAFVDRDGTIYEVKHLKPMSPKIVEPSKPWRYAIEMPDGWFDDCETPCVISKTP